MKHTLLLLFLTLNVPIAFAKETTSSLPVVYPYFTISQVGGNPSPSIATSRIIGQSYFRFKGQSFVPQDSITYNYSFGRSGELSPDLGDEYVQFETSVTYLFNTATQQNYPRFRRYQDFDNAGKSVSYNCQKWDFGFSNWKDSARYFYTYNGSQQVSSTSFDLWYGSAGWVPHVYYNNLFNPDGSIAEMNSNIYRIAFTYDIYGYLQQQTEQVKITPSSPFSNLQKNIFTYAAGNQIPDTQITQKWVNGAWENQERRVNIFSANQLIETITFTWDNTWIPAVKSIFTYDVLGNKVEELVQVMLSNATFENAERSIWSYNAENQPVLFQTETWNEQDSSWTSTDGDVLYRFHYEIFNPAAIKDLKAIADVVLFPVPANDVVHLKVAFSKPQQSIVQVYDMQGREVFQSVEGINSILLKDVPVQSFPAGQYFISVKGKEEEAHRTFTIVR